MLNRSASLVMSTCILKALPGKLDIKRHEPGILYLQSKEGSSSSVKAEATETEPNIVQQEEPKSIPMPPKEKSR